MRFASYLLPLCALAALACSSPSPSGPGEPLQRRAQAAKKGDLIVTEIYPNPVGATEDNKEWFEVYNTTDVSIDLDGWTFKDDKNTAVLSGTAVVPPKGYAVIGQSKDKALNGGIQVDAEYGTKVGLSSTADEIHLIDPGGTEIDAVVYNTVAPWPPKTKGVAIQLDPSRFSGTDNDDGASWCLSTTPYGSDGGLGTPGKANESCGFGTGGAAGSGGEAGSGGAAAGSGGAAGGVSTGGASGNGGAAGEGGSDAGSGGTGGGTGGSGGEAGGSDAGAGGSDVGTGGAAGSGQGGSGQGGSGQGGSGAGGCQVRLHKIDLNQPDPPGAPKDAFEAVELRVDGPILPGTTTLADCGVTMVSPFDADATAGVCGVKAGYYNELSVGDLVIPASGFVVVGNIPASDRPWNNKDGAPATVLQNGPDYLALRGPDGGIVDAVSYADNDDPELYADCATFASASQIPADVNTKDSPALNQVLALCQDGTWKLLLEAEIAWKSPNPCGAAGTGGAGGSGGSGAGGSGTAGSAGSGQGGSSAAGAGGSTAGGAGGSGTAGSGQAGSGQGGSTGGTAGSNAGGNPGSSGQGGSGTAGSGTAGAPATGGQGGAAGSGAPPGEPAQEDGDCSCQTPGAPGSARGGLALLGLAALAVRRRRGA